MNEAAYQIVARDLRAEILKNSYGDGVAMPTEVSLATQYNLSRQTVRRAFQELASEGLIYRVRGRGTFTAPRDGRYLRQFGSIEDLMGLSVDTELELLTPLRRRIELDAASRLQLPSDEVYSVSFRRLHDDRAFCVTNVYLPLDVGDLLRTVKELKTPGQRSSITVIGVLDGLSPNPIAKAEQSITVALANEEVSKSLDCEVGHPMLRIDRLYYTTADDPVELASSLFLPEVYSYRVRLHRGA